MNVFEQMLASYEVNDREDKLNAIHEVMQQVTLAALGQGGFFEKAAFYGGTCLRIFHGLPRFSEALDFSLLRSEPDFSLEPYFPGIETLFASMGQKVHLSVKKKSKQSTIHSAFLKSDTVQYDLQLERGRNIRIKIEVDTTPPLMFDSEQKLLLHPYSFYTRCFTLPCLFAGKMHALMYRGWKNRVKGRDWFDFEWYVRRGVPLNFSHFCERVRQFASADAEGMTVERFRSELKEKLRSVSVDAVRRDVEPFVRDVHALDIWSADYFCALADMLRVE